MRESEKQFRLFFSNAPVYCYMVSPDGTILSVNKTTLDSLGYKEDELVGRNIASLYAPDELARVQKLIEEWKGSGNLRKIGIQKVSQALSL